MQNNIDSEIMLSVIIPTCNRNNTLPRAIYSVLSQNVTGLEVIVVNDTDNPIADEILNIAISHPVVFVTNPGKHGAASTRNYGVSVAKGTYITFLDDDDFLLPGRLECMVNRFNQKNDNIVLVSTGRVYEYNNFERIEIVRNQIFGRLKLNDIFIHNQIDIGFMIKKSTFIELNGFDTTFNNLEDWDFIIRCLLLGDAYKIKSYSYIVKNDNNPNRVSNNDYLGLKQLASKHKNHFGDKWFYKIKAQQKLSEKSLSISSILVLIFRTKSVYPLRLWLGSFVRRLLEQF